ncbi:hypothetical protein VE00_07425 [Pseudogymnoascus sp. WSF 3629]|nr:hypothetical protein VE00_07425 [Pseudogymnoascus sp. WSF 3629]
MLSKTRSKPTRDQQASQQYASSSQSTTAETVAIEKHRTGAPSIDFDNKRMRRMFRAICAGVPWKYIPVMMKEEPSETNPNGFRPGLSSCRTYWNKAIGLSPGKVLRLGDKNIQRALNIRTFERLVATQAAWTPLALSSISFSNTETNLDMVDNTKQVAHTSHIRTPSNISSHSQAHSFAPSSSILAVPALDGIIQSQRANELDKTQAFGNPLDTSYSPSTNDGNNDPTPQLDRSHVKRSNPYANDDEDTDRLLRKMLNNTKGPSSLAPIPTSPVLAPTLDQSRPGMFVEGPRPRPVNNRREKTVQDVEKAMDLPPGCSLTWRNTNSSIDSSTSSTTRSGKSCFSLILDPLAFANQDDASVQPSLVTELFGQFEKFGSDNEIALGLRSLLQAAGDTAHILANTRNHSQMLPLELTIRRGLFESCRELLDYGADVGKTASTGIKMRKFTKGAQKAAADDPVSFYAIGICYKLVTTYSKPPTVKIPNPRPMQASAAKLERSILVKPRPMTSNLKGIASESPHMSENGRNRYITAHMPVAQDRPCDNLEPNKGSPYLTFHAHAHGQLYNEDYLPQWPETESPLTSFDGVVSDALASTTLHASDGSITHDNVRSPLYGWHMVLPDGQIGVAFPYKAKVSHLPMLNSSVPVLHPSGTSNSWLHGTVQSPLHGSYMALPDGQIVMIFPVPAQVSDLQRLSLCKPVLHPSGTPNLWIAGNHIDVPDMPIPQVTDLEGLPLSLPFPLSLDSGRNFATYEGLESNPSQVYYPPLDSQPPAPIVPFGERPSPTADSEVCIYMSPLCGADILQVGTWPSQLDYVDQFCE